MVLELIPDFDVGVCLTYNIIEHNENVVSVWGG